MWLLISLLSTSLVVTATPLATGFSSRNDTHLYQNSTSALTNGSYLQSHSLTNSTITSQSFSTPVTTTTEISQIAQSTATTSLLSLSSSINSTSCVDSYNPLETIQNFRNLSATSTALDNSTAGQLNISSISAVNGSRNGASALTTQFSSLKNSTISLSWNSTIFNSTLLSNLTNTTAEKTYSRIPSTWNSTNLNSTMLPTSTNIGSGTNSTFVSSSPTPSYQNTTVAATPFRFHRLNAAVATSTSTPKPKDVFAHYLVGTVTADHANKDIDAAIEMGLDGFALNIGDPSADFLEVSLDNLFGYAEYVGFKLFISMDVYASGNSCANGRKGACGGPLAYESILKGRLGSSSWYQGPNGLPMISTYSSGGEQIDVWDEWKKTDFASTMYFIPDFDETLGYYETDAGWYAYWGDLVNGAFSWESAWPYRSGFGGNSPGDISPDLPVQSEMASYKKGYMMPLSTLQYKNAYGANVYRAGDLNLPIRMENILSMDNAPDFVQVITWNDGPEGHYIGNLWLEQNNDTAPMKYANQIDFPHNAWRPLITSFINAYKNGDQASDMAPPSNSAGVGAMWYTTILQSAVCPAAPNPSLYNASKPDGFETGNDQLNWAVIVPSGEYGYTIRANSNGEFSDGVSLNPGLNYGFFPVTAAGYQRMEVFNNGNVVLAAGGGRCISDGCPDCIYNMNPQVIGFVEDDDGSLGTCPYQNCQKKVFAHYMIGNLYEDHVHKDIDDAANLGLDGFALNVGDPTQPFVRQTFDYMFDYARDNHPDFKLFISMDLWAEGNAFEGVHIDKYHDLLQDFLGHDAWLRGPNGFPFVSSYSSGGLNASEWIKWKEDWANAIYLVPDIDDTAGYNTSDPGWWDYWGDIIDGVMSWETTWPKPGLEQAGDISIDEVIVQGTYEHRKAYMMPLSALQYKNAYDTNYYRLGDLNLPIRIEKILSMTITPDFVQYLTWNDGPESHYIGNLWSEQNNDTQPGLYANQDDWSHTGWQPLLASFINAFKAGLPASSMDVPNGEVAVGALWYKTVLQSTTCPVIENQDEKYSVKPNGFDVGTDQLNWAVVLPSSSQGMSIRLISDGQVISTVGVKPGLNYGFGSGVQTGHQRMELVDSSGAIVLAAAGGRCIATNCPDCIYNMNPQVVPLVADTGAIGPCPDQNCVTGTCSTYIVKDIDTCASIGSKEGLTTDEIESYNTQTWGWYGCDDLPNGLIMCISSGDPPLPATLNDAVCGPQVPGTQLPMDGTSLADLNPCSLNACCNNWGQCGIDTDFCEVSYSTTRNPGTVRPGTNGCISNCGINMVSGDAPETFRRIAYFEGFNQERDCEYADFIDINFSNYTAIHFAFATITDDFQVDISAVGNQFDQFQEATDYDRVLSFGGWSFATSQDSTPIFRSETAEIQRFITSLVSFVNEYDLDGVDFDWEYAAAETLPGVPDTTSQDGENYLSFLQDLRAALPSGVTLSIAVPASYRRLQNFPIVKMGEVVDYIVYMTYDLHGQWEYGQTNLNSGCPDGNCLRSHVNGTETRNAIALITKAGVPSSKVVVGMSSFGRSFEMAEAGCHGPSCTYTGPSSGATPGGCTTTAGILSLTEIQGIFDDDDSLEPIADGSGSWILVYNDTQWVSYTDALTKYDLVLGYRVENLGGIADWAIDLDLNAANDNDYVPIPGPPSCDDIDTYSTLDEIIADTSIPDACKNKYTIPILSATLADSLSNYTDIMSHNYDSRFKAYAGYISLTAEDNMNDWLDTSRNGLFTCLWQTSGNNKVNETKDCPSGEITSNWPSAIYMIPNNLTEFYLYMEETYGFEDSWIEFYDSDSGYYCEAREGCGSYADADWIVYGEQRLFSNFSVSNPKDLISASLSNITDLSDYLVDVSSWTNYDLWDGNNLDVIDAAALPVFMVQNAVLAMNNVSIEGKAIKAAERKEEIFLFLSAFLFLLPFVGEAIDSVFDVAAISRIFTLVSDAGNAAIDLYSTVQDPKNAPAVIFDLLLGGAALRSSKAMADAAATRRVMEDSEITSFGVDLSTSMDKVSSIEKKCIG